MFLGEFWQAVFSLHCWFLPQSALPQSHCAGLHHVSRDKSQWKKSFHQKSLKHCSRWKRCRAKFGIKRYKLLNCPYNIFSFSNFEQNRWRTKRKKANQLNNRSFNFSDNIVCSFTFCPTLSLLLTHFSHQQPSTSNMCNHRHLFRQISHNFFFYFYSFLHVCWPCWVHTCMCMSVYKL